MLEPTSEHRTIIFASESQPQILLVERLMNPHVRTVNPHEVARELIKLHKSRDVNSVRKLRDAYLIGQGRLHPVRVVDEVRELVDGNLLYAAGLADIVASSGYEASGQLHVQPRLDGSVARFYQEATGYKPQ